MKPPSPFRRDFTLVVIGQIISLFGNAVLRFALSLYVLSLTGSAAVFGGILAVAMVPTVLLSPIGGVLADRMPRQRIMVVLDFSSCAFILLYDLLFAASGSLAAITVFLVLLSLIQAVYQPSVQASIPSLVDPDSLMAANGVVMQVQALASLLGPILAAVLYAAFGLGPILAVSAACFFGSAVLELFIRIPFSPMERTASALGQIRRDLGDAFRFLSRDDPHLLQLLGIIALINLFLSALYMVGMPWLVKVYLGLSDQLYGFAEASMGVGAILGGLLSGVLGARVGFRRSHLFLLAAGLTLLPLVAVLGLGGTPGLTYAALLAAMALGMAAATLFSIVAQTYLQQETPPALLGKVASFVTTICTCALPVGQAMYGGFFEALRALPGLVFLLGTLVTVALALATRKVLHRAVSPA